jgi:hypothetical protein
MQVIYQNIRDLQLYNFISQTRVELLMSTEPSTTTLSPPCYKMCLLQTMSYTSLRHSQVSNVEVLDITLYTPNSW